MSFRKATKSQIKLRIALSGPSGSGKTYTALKLAENLGTKVALIDTERNSADRYADIFEFDVAPLQPPYHPKRYINRVEQAKAYDVLIVDSLSHAWAGSGGLLQIVDEYTQLKKCNSFTAWRHATPIQNDLLDALLAFPGHLVVCLRAKQEYALDRNEKQQVSVKKLGLAPIQRDGVEYEFDIFGEMSDGNLLVQKTRCPELHGRVFKHPGKDVADILKTWITPSLTSDSATAEQRAQMAALSDNYHATPPMIAGLRKRLDDESLTRDEAQKMIERAITIITEKEAQEASA